VLKRNTQQDILTSALDSARVPGPEQKVSSLLKYYRYNVNITTESEFLTRQNGIFGGSYWYRTNHPQLSSTSRQWRTTGIYFAELGTSATSTGNSLFATILANSEKISEIADLKSSGMAVVYC
jgi:hypothetical protein